MEELSATTDAKVAILMGSESDWGTMINARDILDTFGIQTETKIMSAHRTPDRVREYVLRAQTRGIKIIIAGAGGAAHLAGAAAALTRLPVLGVPMKTDMSGGLDSLLSTVQMPRGIPVATFAVGVPGAVNAALFAAAILALGDTQIDTELAHYRSKQSGDVPADPTKRP